MKRFASFLAPALALLLGGCGGSLPDVLGGGGNSGGGTPAGTAEQQHNLDKLNEYRAMVGAPALVMDAQLNTFAIAGSQQESNDHTAHAHFNAAAAAGTLFTTDGFTGSAGENQGDPNGWPPLGGVDAQVDQILAAMWAEGPGGGHHDNIANPNFRRVGIGLVVTSGGYLYLTNDFSE